MANYKAGKMGMAVYYININIYRNVRIEQRAEGGGQINRNVGTNANQGGQNAIKHSRTANKKSQFSNGNGRSGIAGKKNDEQGGQSAIKIGKGRKNTVKQIEKRIWKNTKKVY